MAVRAGTPEDILVKIEHAVIALARDPSVRERLAGIGAELVASPSADFAAFLAQERARWSKVIADAGIRIE